MSGWELGFDPEGPGETPDGGTQERDTDLLGLWSNGFGDRGDSVAAARQSRKGTLGTKERQRPARGRQVESCMAAETPLGRLKSHHPKRQMQRDPGHLAPNPINQILKIAIAAPVLFPAFICS